MAVSQDDLVSGELVIASLPMNSDDSGPTVTVPSELGDRVRTERYSADGYLGQKITFSDLSFSDITLLTEEASSLQQYRLSFQRSGDLVTMSGSVDLSKVPADRADVQIKIAFPGEVTRTNGKEEDGTVTWKPKPSAVTEFDATARYAGSTGPSLITWGLMVGGGAVAVAVIVALLALLAHRRSVRAETRAR